MPLLFLSILRGVGPCFPLLPKVLSWLCWREYRLYSRCMRVVRSWRVVFESPPSRMARGLILIFGAIDLAELGSCVCKALRYIRHRVGRLFLHRRIEILVCFSCCEILPPGFGVRGAMVCKRFTAALLRAGALAPLPAILRALPVASSLAG